MNISQNFLKKAKMFGIGILVIEIDPKLNIA